MEKQRKTANGGKKNECSSKNPSLDTNTKIVRQKSENVNFKLRIWKMRKVASGVLDFAEEIRIKQENKYPRICLCGTHFPDKRESIVLVAKGEHTGKSFYSNLMSCGSVWRCPVCSFKITKTRQVEVFKLLKFYQQQGNNMTFLTLTLRHSRKASVHYYLKVLLEEFRKFQRVRRFSEFRKSYIGVIKTLELTYSDRNGWHPHLHLLFVHEKGITHDYVAKLLNGLLPFWCKRPKINATIKNQKFKPVYTTEDISDYITKWDVSKEITQSNLKKAKKESTTGFGLLADYLDGKIDYSSMSSSYLMYVTATKYKNHIIVSPELRKQYKIVNPNTKEDWEIVKNELVEKFLFSIGYELWRVIVERDIAPLLLSAYDYGGFDAVCLKLNEFGISYDVEFDKDLKINFLY